MLLAILAMLALLIVCAAVLSRYLRLVALRTAMVNAFAHVDRQLKHRYELAPAVAESLRPRLPGQSVELDAVIAARHRALVASRDINPTRSAQLSEAMHAEAALVESLVRLKHAIPVSLVSEGRPALPGVDELFGLQDRIALAMQSFNHAVADYNAHRRGALSGAVASMFRLGDATAIDTGTMRAGMMTTGTISPATNPPH